MVGSHVLLRQSAVAKAAKVNALDNVSSVRIGYKQILEKLSSLSHDERIRIMNHTPEDALKNLGFPPRHTMRLVWTNRNDTSFFNDQARQGKPSNIDEEEIKFLHEDIAAATRAKRSVLESVLADRLDLAHQRTLAKREEKLNTNQIQELKFDPHGARLSRRCIYNYTDIVLCTGAKVCRRPQIRDTARAAASESLMNVVSTYLVAQDTHTDVHPSLLLNLDLCQVQYYFYNENQVQACIVPDHVTKDITGVGVKAKGVRPLSIHQIVLANREGEVGPLWLKISLPPECFRDCQSGWAKFSVVGLQIVKSSFAPSTVLVLVPQRWNGHGSVIEHYLKDAFTPFVQQLRTRLEELLGDDTELIACLWVDKGHDVLQFLHTSEGSQWAESMQLRVNENAAKYTHESQVERNYASTSISSVHYFVLVLSLSLSYSLVHARSLQIFSLLKGTGRGPNIS